MPSIIDCAELSSAAYNKTGDVAVELKPPTRISWKRVCSWSNRVGFYSALFVSSSNSSVLAFRGTDDFWDGLVDDVAVALHQMPPQAAAAIQVVGATGARSNLMLTGHSLGGALALIAAAYSGLPAITFNAPGVMDACVASAVWSGGLGNLIRMASRCATNRRVRNVRTEGDLVSTAYLTGAQSGGRNAPLSASQCGFDALCRHSVATCLAALRRDAKNFDEVKL